MKLYYVNDKYIEYLRTFDEHIYMNKESRPYVGIVLDVNGFNYYAALSSPKPKHSHMSNDKDFRKIAGGKYGVINFNYMIPVQSSQLTEVDFLAISDQKYRRLLENQIMWLNNDESNIKNVAKELYKLFFEDESILTRHDIDIKRRCCNFKLLEEKCMLYV